MDRALRLDLIETALGRHTALPTARQLADLLGQAEVALIRGAREVDPQLVVTGWYLHSVGSALPALQLYGLDRQRKAFQVAGHIFDLALNSEETPTVDRLRFTFASQVANLRGALDPNSIAAYRWRRGDLRDIAASDPELPLQIGASLLAMDTPWLFGPLLRARDLLGGLDDLADEEGEGGLYRARRRLAQGAANLHRFLVYGDEGAIETASAQLEEAARDAHPAADVDARWVAFHLWQLIDHFRTGSLWSVLPPDSPPSVARAFTMNQPAILSLWPPQVDLLHRDRVPYALDPDVRRLVFSIPTSAGKTLLAQVMAANHLMREGTAVCFVAPTRSLCREIEASFRSRLRVLMRSGDVEFDDALFQTVNAAGAVVHVMTPERLAFLMRTDLAAVLATYGLFVFDEAHTIADRDRGWTLEWVLSTLHAMTDDTRHRIVAMSAALGNRGALGSWLDPRDVGFRFNSEWRGPRRLHAIYTTVKDESSARPLPRPHRDSPERVAYDLRGRLHLRLTATGRVTALDTTQAVGTLVVRPREGWGRDAGASTPFYHTLAPLVEILGRGGPVLVITPTKVEASRLARVIAERGHGAGPSWLSEVASSRLGAEHPLVACLEAGVAYHHASLPSEILQGIESEVVSGGLSVIVATTTLTEGVNLPVKTVVISAQGTYGPEGFEEFIVGARMLNAIGRAGRAGKESEGWIVLARSAQFDRQDFARLDPADADMSVVSTLLLERALAELAELEERLRADADAAMEHIGQYADGFVSFVWYLATLAGQRNEDPPAFVDRVLGHTLAWQQLGNEHRLRYAGVARRVVASHGSLDEATRLRWSRGGTSISTAARLEALVDEIVRFIRARGAVGFDTALDALAAVGGDGRLERLYALPEAAIARPHNQRSGRGTREVAIDHVALLLDWVSGSDVHALAEKFLPEIADVEFRLEELADLTTSAFDRFLPWVLGIVIEWVNTRLEADGVDESLHLPPSLPAFVRYGVATDEAVQLIRSGVVSRPLASRVAAAYLANADRGDKSQREWLCEVDFGVWRERFLASPLDLRSLLEFARPRDARLAARVLNNELIEIDVRMTRDLEGQADAVLAEVPEDEPPRRLGLSVAGALIATIPPVHQAEIAMLAATGIPLSVVISMRDGHPIVGIALAEAPTQG